MKKQKEFTINIDVVIRAKDQTEAVNKLYNIIDLQCEYWIGNITEILKTN